MNNWFFWKDPQFAHQHYILMNNELFKKESQFVLFRIRGEGRYLIVNQISRNMSMFPPQAAGSSRPRCRPACKPAVNRPELEFFEFRYHFVLVIL